jgi:sec-independent protein translocase protein TatB
MFGIGMAEFMVIMAVALIIVGPEDLPKVARWLAKAIKYLRRSIKDITAAINLDEEIREVKEAGAMLRETVHDINPISGITDELNAVKRETQEVIKPLKDLVDFSDVPQMITGTDTKKTPDTGGISKDAGKEGTSL